MPSVTDQIPFNRRLLIASGSKRTLELRLAQAVAILF
jgi:hypothetical protein